MKDFKYCVCIGRFQPFTHTHHELIKEALSNADKVILIIGSAHKAPSVQNPWSEEQRITMISDALSEEERSNVIFDSVKDYWYSNNRWLTEVQQIVFDATDGADNKEICFLGEEDYFPQWKFLKMRYLERNTKASYIRGLYFTYDNSYKHHVSNSVLKFMEDFRNTAPFKILKDEFDFVERYKAAWDGAPFKPTFMTTDCIVVKSGHILCVRRKGNPGKGLIALPGGFLLQTETCQEGAIRELKEETAIKVSKDELRKHIVDQKVFDFPGRSLRGRTITVAFYIDLGTGPLPQVKGSDDAEKAFWLSLGEFNEMEEEFFEDHWQIISHFISKY